MSSSTLTSHFAFKGLVSLLVIALLLQLSILSWHHHHEVPLRTSSVTVGRHAVAKIEETEKTDEIERSPHLNPHLPPLPPFASVPNSTLLASETLSGQNPTIAGIAAVLQRFLLAMHESNQKLSRGGRGTDRDILRHRAMTAFRDLASDHLLPLDRAYRNRPVFPVREDGSIFISLASYRDYLLGETLKEAFGRAAHPDRIFVGAVVQNCFGIGGGEKPCRTGVEVVGKDANGRDMTRVSDAPPDVNGIAEFCSDPKFSNYCDRGHIRVLYVEENESQGPAMARYYASKLWGGETYFLQADAHLKFVKGWDEGCISEVKATKSYPKAVLSSYPPGFENFREGTPGTRLCTCEFSRSDIEDSIIRINTGADYVRDQLPPRPTQIAFIAAGFFFCRSEFLVDVPFDPLLPWSFMGEEIALSMRAWTSGWNIYAPRTNLLAHQYRPGRMGLPKFWESVGRMFGRPGPGFSNHLQEKIVKRVKHMVGYPECSRENMEADGDEDILLELEHYGLGTERPREDYLKLTKIDFAEKKCHNLPWCNRGELE